MLTNQHINLVDYKQMNRFNELLFNEALFSVLGNKDFIKSNYRPELVGIGFIIFSMATRFGLFVEGGEWLTMNNSKNELPVAFTSCTIMKIQNAIYII